MLQEEFSYIDYEAFLDPSFSAASFANTLVLATNNPSDTPLDLSTPLSRVLFDVQEVDTHIDNLTTRSALPLLEHTKDHAEASGRILQEVEAQVASLTESYKTLEKEVIERYEAAEQVRLAAERLCQTVKVGRAVGRCLMLGRQLEAQMAELNASGAGPGKREDHRGMVRSSNTLLSLRQLFLASKPGQEGEGLERINVVTALKNELVAPAEQRIISRSQQIVREFSMSSLLASNTSSQPSSSASTYAQTEDTKSRATSALLTLYLLSPTPIGASTTNFVPTLLIDALRDYLQTALKSSLAALARALATLPTLDRTLLEVAARCQNIVALETLLESIKPPQHPLLASPSTVTNMANGETSDNAPYANLLQPLLHSLDTSSLPSYFWRSLSSALSPRVQDIINKGGVSARTLRSNRDRVRDSIRECVNRGSQLPASPLSRGKGVATGNWEREAAVMVGAVLGVLGR
ncbi:Conserved oligomeric Golgi complex subunit [Coniosporium apollinis]|uniref:Conserved oligomeric Golgi complex subunit 5 n=2 Tax=Coniosporium TaxID=2810619 RepID=A0ABQ9NYV2_9PEZI|nr:Conserved oligomeric Golgi complex subunit [Cladosporium sp. JES 115]KAJ9666469.1 Conserved oligomeric Golgi complex subunit [Coniosporium apollinis]